MKFRPAIILTLLLAALVLILGGCDLLLSGTPETVLAGYMSLAISGSYDSMYTYISENNYNYAAFRDGDLTFGSIYQYGVFSYDIVSISGDTYTVDVTYGDQTYTESFSFVSELLGGYKIQNFTAYGTAY